MIEMKNAKVSFMILNLIISVVAIGFFIGVEIGGGAGAEESVSGGVEAGAGLEAGGGPSQVPVPDEKTGGSWWKVFGEGEGTLGSVKGQGVDAGFSALMWAAIAYGAGQLIGSFLGLSESNTGALSLAAALGTGSGVFFGTLESGSLFEFFSFGSASWAPTAHPALWGIGIGVTVFILMYKEESTKIVTFDCLPWQAPTGGNACEQCNDNELPCSEYRCKSLGGSCELVNEGTDEEMCVYANPSDVAPPTIEPNTEELTEGYEYTNVKNSPPGPGFSIERIAGDNKCIEAFTPLSFGITTSEPSQCKVDYNSTRNFEEMRYFFGGSNLYSYDHEEILSLPGPANLNSENLTIKNDGKWTIFVRCMDRNGNQNEAEYAIRFCVDPEPDTTAPKIQATSIEEGSCVAADKSTAEVDFYVNEPSECRWSVNDQDFDLMENSMACSSSLHEINALQLYTCKAELTGVLRDGSDYYVRCKDQPNKEANERNENMQSYVFSLRGSTELKLKTFLPNDTVFGGVNPTPVELYAETLFGCNDGKAICYYSTTGKEGSYVAFFDTDNKDGVHTQNQNLGSGRKRYFIKCVDAGGNVVEDSVVFDVEIDESAPVVARAYKEEGMLKITTVRESECAFSNDNCDFSFDEGVEMPYANSTTHVTEWNEEKTYYIKCRDEFVNENADCSIVVKPSKGF